MVYSQKLIWLLLIFLGLANNTFAAAPPEKPITLDSELVAAHQHLEKVDPLDRPFIKFLTTYAYPPLYRDEAAMSVSFILHSLTGVPNEVTGGNSGYFAPIAIRAKLEKTFVMVYKQKVEGSDTLFWIDIRDYNWTEQAFETVSVAEPYVRKPWINSDVYDAIRIMSGNALIRADWFLSYTTDVTKQADFEAGNNLNTTACEPFYYVLLYANAKIPRNADDYRAIWGINVDRINKLQLARGTIVDRGHSGQISGKPVSRNSRELAKGPFDLGYHWESSDFKHNRGKRNPIENLSIERNNKGRAVHVNIGRQADAHELITSNLLGLQVYYLTDGVGKRVEFADPTIVRDTSDRLDDVRVRTARSCIVCHPFGINVPLDALRLYLDDGVDLIVGSKEYKQALKQFYLTDLGAMIQDDQVRYARSVVQTNGLLPEENARIYQKMMDWYDKDVTLVQAARECGVTIDEFVAKVGRAAKGKLARLTNSEDKGYGIPRAEWDDPEDGDFKLAMLLIHDEVSLKVQKEILTVIIDECPIKLGDKTLKTVNKDEKFEVVEKKGEWFKVDLGGQTYGYIWEKHVKIH